MKIFNTEKEWMMNSNTVTFDGLTPKYAWPRTAFSVLLSFCSPWAKKKDLLPWLMLHKVTDGKYTWFKEALKKYLIHNLRIIIIITIDTFSLINILFTYLFILLYRYEFWIVKECKVCKNEWNYSSPCEMLMEINHIPFIQTSSFT